jgi:biofilm PGA synthesis N-glycosyltransferase PgaC
VRRLFYMSKQLRRYKLALLIAAHNEELVIGATIKSAIRAGIKPRDIFVVDDNSSDQTAIIAANLLGASNVLTVKRSGKAKALRQAIDHFRLIKRYSWLHLADADGVFGPGYFRIFRKALTASNHEVVAVTGHIQSLRGGWISKYRVYEYSIGLEIIRRIQHWFGVIPVMPGPTSCFRSNIIDRLEFEVDSLTEDFDITLQIHRKKLGKILFVPQARTFTQDPKDLADYIKQIQRWYRGNFQCMQRHRIGLRLQRIDAYLTYLMTEQLIYLLELMAMPLVAWYYNSYRILAVSFLSDLAVLLGFTIWAAMLNRRKDIVAAFPLFYFLRYINLFIFVKAFFEVIVLRRFRSVSPGWATEGRRYQITPVN